MKVMITSLHRPDLRSRGWIIERILWEQAIEWQFGCALLRGDHANAVAWASLR